MWTIIVTLRDKMLQVTVFFTLSITAKINLNVAAKYKLYMHFCVLFY
jgi:hypothetical protein